MTLRKEFRSVGIGVSIPENLIPEIDEMARSQKRSRSGLINCLIIEALEKHWAEARKKKKNSLSS